MSNEKNETTGGEHNAEKEQPCSKCGTPIIGKGEEDEICFDCYLYPPNKTSDEYYSKRPIKIQKDGRVYHNCQSLGGISAFISKSGEKIELSLRDSLRVIEATVKYLNQTKNEGRHETRTIKDKENQKKIDELLETTHTTKDDKVFTVKNIQFTSNNVGEILVRFEHAGDAHAAKEYVQRSLDYIKKQMEENFKSRD